MRATQPRLGLVLLLIGCENDPFFSFYMTFIYLTIIRRARVGYEMIDSQRGATRRVGYNHLISNKRKWNNCFIKNNQEILLDLADFAVQEEPADNLMVAILGHGIMADIPWPLSQSNPSNCIK